VGIHPTSGQLARTEFGEGVGHLWRAATHGARGVGGAVGPRLRGAGAAALVPLAAVARTGLAEVEKVGRRAGAEAPRLISKTRAAVPRDREGSKMSRKRTRVLAGILAAGTAAGIAGALVARRRSRSRWDEYESQGRASVAGDLGDGAEAGGAERDWDGAGRPDGRTAAGGAAEAAAEPGDLTADDFADNASAASRNGRG
jgi:hypothetical protein